jgi:tight junction protein 1
VPFLVITGEKLLSPIIKCCPQGLQFLVPVTLQIPHVAHTSGSLGLALKATDTEKDMQTNWENTELTNIGTTVSVKVDHF